MISERRKAEDEDDLSIFLGTPPSLAAAADANPGSDAYGLALSSNHAYSVAFNGYALG